jgi:hypothetical protein
MVCWCDLAQDGDKWRALVNAVMKSSCECGDEPLGSTECCTTVGHWSSAQLRRVRWLVS